MKNILLVFCLILIPFSSGALEIGDIDDERIVSIETPEPPLNISNLSVLSANIWNTTSLGPLDDANTTQFENEGGTLHLLDSWLNGLYLQRANDLSDVNDAATARTNLGLVAGGAGDIWVEKAGDTMTGKLINTQSSGGFGATVEGVQIITSKTGLGGSMIGLDIDSTFTAPIGGTGYGIDLNFDGATGVSGVGMRINGDPPIMFDFSSTGGVVAGGVITANTLNANAILLSLASSESSSNPKTMYKSTLSGSPSVGQHYEAFTGTKQVFFVDVAGNLGIGGAYISPRGTIGSFGNLLNHSNQFEQSSWSPGTNLILTSNFGEGPDGKANTSTKYDPTGTVDWGQTIVGEAASGNTYTISGWGKKNVAEQSIRFQLDTSTGADPSGSTSLSFNSFDWEYKSFTYTFGAVGGDVRIEGTNTAAATEGEIYGLQVTKTNSSLGYTPTQNYPVSIDYGTVSKGVAYFGSDSEPTTIKIIAGDNQTTTNLFEVQDNTTTAQVFIDSNFNFNLIDNVKSIYGTDNGLEISHDGTVNLFNSSNGPFKFIGEGIWANGTTGTTPTSGSGTRLMWIPAKAAFRAGSVTTSDWDDGNIGTRSIGLGNNALASGLGSISIGDSNDVTTPNGFGIGFANDITSFSNAGAMGVANVVSGVTLAFAYGWANTASGISSYTFGEGNTAAATTSIAIGKGNEITAPASSGVSVGTNNDNTAINTLTLGGGNLASGSGATTIGITNTASDSKTLAIGTWTAATAASSAVIGLGAASGSRLTNSLAGSLAFGMNSTVPTMVITDGGGVGGFGNVQVLSTNDEAFSVIGHSQFGSGTPGNTDDVVLSVIETFTDTGSGAGTLKSGISNSITLTGVGDGTHYALSNSIQTTASSGTQDLLVGGFFTSTINNAGVTVTDLRGNYGINAIVAGTVINSAAYRSAYLQLGGTVTNTYGFYAQDQLPIAGTLTNAYGMLIEKQTGGTNNFGLVLDGDGVGADIVFGASQIFRIYDNGINAIYNRTSGEHKFISDVNVTGNLTVIGNITGNLFYGSMHQAVDDILIDITSSGVYFNLTNMTAEFNNGFVFFNNTLTANHTGIYKVDWHMGFSDGGNTDFKAALTFNGNVTYPGLVAHTHTGAANDETHFSAGLIVQINEGDVMRLAIQNEDNTNNPTITHSTVNAQWVGFA